VLEGVSITQLVTHPRVDGEIKRLVILSRTVAGLRAGDLNALDWTAFSPGYTTCTFVRRKTRKKRPCPETHEVPEGASLSESEARRPESRPAQDGGHAAPETIPTRSAPTRKATTPQCFSKLGQRGNLA
jgi:hypothetical protein